MVQSTILLCSFTTEEKLEECLKSIVYTYDIAFDNIYVLENTESSGSLCVTYNIIPESTPNYPLLPSTISLHRKKSSNTLYSLNALNLLVQQYNNGKLDPKFIVPWEEVRNSILVTTYNQLRKIPTKIKKIIKASEIK